MNRNRIVLPTRSLIVHRQSGLSLISWLVVIVLVGLLALAAFRVVPAYIECARIGSALESIQQAAATESVDSLRRKLSSQITIDSLRDVTLDEFKFAFHGDNLTISIDKPIRRSFIGNLGFVVECKHTITVTRESDY